MSMTPKDLGPLEFKAEDVAIVVGRIYDVYDHTADKKLDKLCAELLNTLLAERIKPLLEELDRWKNRAEQKGEQLETLNQMIERAPEVFGVYDTAKGAWTSSYDTELDSYRARLVCIEKLEGK